MSVNIDTADKSAKKAVVAPEEMLEPAVDGAAGDPQPDEELTTLEIEQLEDVLEHIAEEKKINLDQTELAALKEDVDEYQEVCVTMLCDYMW